MTPARSWWKSGYDGQWHSFLTEQHSDPAVTFLAARCEHSVPKEHVDRHAPVDKSKLCRACVGHLTLDELDAGGTGAMWRAAL